MEQSLQILSILYSLSKLDKEVADDILYRIVKQGELEGKVYLSLSAERGRASKVINYKVLASGLEIKEDWEY